MTTYEETVSLRKGGDPEASYNLAMKVRAEDPGCEWVYNQIGWCLYEMLNQEAGAGNADGFLARLHEYAGLNRERPIDPNITRRLVWPIRRMVAGCIEQDYADDGVLYRVLAVLRQIPFDTADENYHILLGAFLKARKWGGLKQLIDWWGLENLQEKDCKPFRTADGRTIMSLAEQTYIAYSNILIGETSANQFANSEALAFAARLAEVSAKHPEFQYPAYFRAKLLLAAGCRSDAVEALLPFVEKKAGDYWVWDLLGDAEEDDGLRLSCYCKALTCRAKEEFLRKLHFKLCDLLAAKGMYAEARAELDEAIAISRRKGWSLPPRYQDHTTKPWYRDAPTGRDNTQFYKENRAQAEQLAYSHFPQTAIVIVNVDKERGVAHFVTAERKQGILSCRQLNAKAGSAWLCRLQNNHKNHCRLLTCQPTDGFEHELLKKFSGRLSVKKGGFGFVDGIFVPRHDAERLGDGADVSGTAIPSFDKGKSTWGWAALTAVQSNKSDLTASTSV